jgi:hypothetical protein
MAILSFGPSMDFYENLLAGVGPPWSTLPALKGTGPWLIYAFSGDNPLGGVIWIHLRARNTSSGQTCQLFRHQFKPGIKNSFESARIIIPVNNLVEANWTGVGLGGIDVMIYYVALG